MKTATWTTQDGRVLDIRWMDSKHLVNSFNMVVRTNAIDRATLEGWKITHNLTKGRNGLVHMRDEIKARQLYHWDDSKSPAQLLTLDVPREDRVQLCMLRAILDAPPRNVEEVVELFHRNPSSYIVHVLESAHPKWRSVQAKFTEYRLEPRRNP